MIKASEANRLATQYHDQNKAALEIYKDLGLRIEKAAEAGKYELSYNVPIPLISQVVAWLVNDGYQHRINGENVTILWRET